MSNGSFLTSQLPVTTNAVASDRLLLLWNAIANVSVGSGTPQTKMITISDLVNNALSTIESDIMSGATLTLGNSSVNTVINSTAFLIQTNLGTVFTVNTAGVVVGNGAGLTTLGSPGSNTNVLFNNSGIIQGAANLTWNGTTLSVGNSGTNTTVNSTIFVNGNTYINSTTLFLGNAGSIIVGNVTYNVAITPQSVTVSNNGNTAWVVTGDGVGTMQTKLTVGNSTVNAAVTSTLLTIANSTLNVSLSALALSFGNSTINAISNATAMGVGVPGSTQGSLLTNNALLIGNSTANTTLGVSSLAAINSTANSTHGVGSIVFSNSTTNSTLTSSTLAIQSNSTSNSIYSNTSIVFNSNTTVNSTLNALALSWGGSSYYLAPPSVSVLTANFAMTSTASAQNTFPSGQRIVTLAASTTYLVEGLYAWLYSNATNVNVAIAFGNSAAIGGIAYRYQFSGNNVSNSTYSGQLSGVAVTNGAVTVNTSTLTTTNNASVFFKGYLVTSGAVNITPQFQTSVATGNAPSMLTGSYIKFVPVGNATINTIGSGWA